MDSTNDALNGPGGRVKYLRGKDTLQDFAAQFGLTGPAISNIERGRTELSALLAIKISEKYGVSMDWLYKGNGTDSENHKVFNEPIVDYKQSSKVVIEKDELIELQRLALKNTTEELKELKSSITHTSEAIKNI